MRLIPKLHPKRNAFTLIELIMTIIVVGIIAIPLSLLLGEHIRSTFYSEDLTLAGNLARFEIEVVNNMNYTNIDNANFFRYQGYNYDVNRTVVDAHFDLLHRESTKKVTVEVKKTGKPVVIAKLVTYLTQNINYPY